MEILVYIEVKEGELVQGSLEALAAAKELGNATALVAGDADAAAKAAVYGAPVVCAKVDAANPDAILGAVEAVCKAKNADAVFFAGTQWGKDLAPRLASRAKTGCITDVTGMEKDGDAILYTRPAFGGTVIEKMKNHGALQVCPIRSGSYSKPEAGAPASIEECDPGEADIRVKVLEAAKEITEAVNLEGADIIVSGGRGMGSKEDFQLVVELAKVLGATVGASRPAIEDGWISRAHQVGQSGKIVAPKLYIACGISGAMQHISGAIGSKYIVAINKDPDASIFSVADLGLVGDAKQIIPLLIEEIKKRK